jgi:hypothetical protein
MAGIFSALFILLLSVLSTGLSYITVSFREGWKLVVTIRDDTKFGFSTSQSPRGFPALPSPSKATTVPTTSSRAPLSTIIGSFRSFRQVYAIPDFDHDGSIAEST